MPCAFQLCSNLSQFTPVPLWSLPLPWPISRWRTGTFWHLDMRNHPWRLCSVPLTEQGMSKSWWYKSTPVCWISCRFSNSHRPFMNTECSGHKHSSKQSGATKSKWKNARNKLLSLAFPLYTSLTCKAASYLWRVGKICYMSNSSDCSAKGTEDLREKLMLVLHCTCSSWDSSNKWHFAVMLLT